MSELELGLAAGLAVLLAGWLVERVRHEQARRRLTRRRVLRVHLKPTDREGRGDGMTIEGVLVTWELGRLVLERPHLVQSEDRTVPLGGQVEILERDILFAQEVRP